MREYAANKNAISKTSTERSRSLRENVEYRAKLNERRKTKRLEDNEYRRKDIESKRARREQDDEYRKKGIESKRARREQDDEYRKKDNERRIRVKRESSSNFVREPELENATSRNCGWQELHVTDGRLNVLVPFTMRRKIRLSLNVNAYFERICILIFDLRDTKKKLYFVLNGCWAS